MPTTRNDMKVANVRCIFTRGEFHRGKTSTASAGGKVMPLPSAPGGALPALSFPESIASVFPAGGRPLKAETGCNSMVELADAASVTVSVWVAIVFWCRRH